MFEGWPTRVVPVHNIRAVADNECYVVGKMAATQDGEPPVCFAAPIADFLVYNEVRCNPSLEDIPDGDIRHNLKKVFQFLRA